MHKNRLSLSTLCPVPYTITIESTQPYLGVTAAGPAPFAESCGLAALVGELVRSQGHRRVLADLSATQPQLSFTEHLRFAALVAELLGRLERLAVVVPPGYLEAPAARAAQLAGLRVKTFLRVADATAWLDQPARGSSAALDGPFAASVGRSSSAA